MSLLVLYFSPDHLRNPSNFEAVSNKLICSPVTQILVFTKVSAPCLMPVHTTNSLTLQPWRSPGRATGELS